MASNMETIACSRYYLSRSKEMKKTRILLFHNIISPHTEVVFQHLAKHTRLHVAYCAVNESNRSWNIKPFGYLYTILPSIKLEFSGRDLFTLILNKHTTKVIEEVRPDIVVISGWDLPTYWQAAFYCLRHHIPYVLWAGSTRHEKSIKRTLTTPMVKLLVKSASAWFSYGTRSKEYLQIMGADPARTHVIFNGFDYKYFNVVLSDRDRTSLLSKLGIPSRSRIVIFFGQLIDRKNPLLLLKAFEKINKESPNAWLLLVGKGYLSDEIQSTIDEQKLKNVTLVESDDDEIVRKYLAASSLLVLPSKEEVWGLAVNEAMATGLPVIASDVVGSSTDLIRAGKTGFTFSNESVDQLSSILTSLLNDDNQRHRLGKGASQHVRICDAPNVAIRMASALNDLNNFSSNSIDKWFVKVQTINDDCHLSVVSSKTVGFPIKRFYYIYNTMPGIPRGFHAHKKNEQFMVCLRGSVRVVMDDGLVRRVVKLDSPNQGLRIPAMIWHEMHGLDNESLLLVAASHDYDEADYIRTYSEFIAELIKNKTDRNK